MCCRGVGGAGGGAGGGGVGGGGSGRRLELILGLQSLQPLRRRVGRLSDDDRQLSCASFVRSVGVSVDALFLFLVARFPRFQDKTRKKKEDMGRGKTLSELIQHPAEDGLNPPPSPTLKNKNKTSTTFPAITGGHRKQDLRYT